MKRIYIAFAAMACVASSQAQIAQITSTERLLAGVESEMYYPVLNEDGSKVLFSSSNYEGLRMYDFNDDVTVKISDEERAGFDASFTPDGRTVYYVSQEKVDGLNMRQVKKYDIGTMKVAAVTPLGRIVSRPIAMNSGMMARIDGKSVGSVAKKEVAVRTEGSTLYISCNGVEKAYSPVESHAGYLWASVSPDKTKVLFFAAAKGVYVVDLNGNILSSLGNYESPVWYGNDCVVAMNAKHNGYQHISSQIVMMRADGSEFQELTRPESMAMNPSASMVGGKIVYNTIDGRLYQMNITLK